MLAAVKDAAHRLVVALRPSLTAAGHHEHSACVAIRPGRRNGAQPNRETSIGDPLRRYYPHRTARRLICFMRARHSEDVTATTSAAPLSGSVIGQAPWDIAGPVGLE